MALAGGVFSQQDVASGEATYRAVADFNVNATIKHHNKLASWSVVKSVIVILVGFSKYDTGCVNPF